MFEITKDRILHDSKSGLMNKEFEVYYQTQYNISTGMIIGAEGAEHLEAIIPLTVGRVPFRVRYTTEFDELGRPIKAYGSATLVVSDEDGE